MNCKTRIMALLAGFLALTIWQHALLFDSISAADNQPQSTSTIHQEHYPGGELELKENIRTGSGNLVLKIPVPLFKRDYSYEQLFCNVQRSFAGCPLILKKHLSLIYVYHNFW